MCYTPHSFYHPSIHAYVRVCARVWACAFCHASPSKHVTHAACQAIGQRVHTVPRHMAKRGMSQLAAAAVPSRHPGVLTEVGACKEVAAATCACQHESCRVAGRQQLAGCETPTPLYKTLWCVMHCWLPGAGVQASSAPGRRAALRTPGRWAGWWPA